MPVHPSSLKAILLMTVQWEGFWELCSQ